jgi:tetratricopeptide (TPR) repeat protein
MQPSGSDSSLDAIAASNFEAGNYNQAIAAWTSMIGKGLNPSEARLNRAKAYLVIRQPLLAIADLESLELAAKRNEKSTLLVLKAVAHGDLGNKKESLRLFNEAEAIDQNPYVYINRASLYQETGNLAEARNDIEKAIAIQPTRANFFNLAVLERRSGRHTECINVLTSILKQDSSFAPAYTQRGICLASIGKHQEAIKDLLKSLAIDSSSADAYFQMGKSMLAIGKSEGAKPYLLKSADIYLSQGKAQSYQDAMLAIANSTK